MKLEGNAFLFQVSSSEDSEHYQRQPSQDDLDRIAMRPPVNKDGIMEKQPIRINFQKPKKIIQEQSNGRLQMAEQLKFSNTYPNSAMLFDDTSSATVSFDSRCDFPEVPKNEDESLQQPVYKKTFEKKPEENKREEEYEKASS
ncbi:hypothetical protein ACJMK2_029522 [Sinanodonta woodiana]|uniref:Uncharacterized protein n=1 Tax=Sinanodonta woodiana TaxID=1069815 RepID=A0ABD3XAE5_SINWO